MKIILSLLLLLLALQSNADDLLIVEPSNDALDKFLDEDINFQSIDSLSDVLDNDNQKYKKYVIKEFVRETPTTPTKLYAVLKKGSSLRQINSDKKVVNLKKIYVNAREVYYGGKWSYIYNKKNEAKYKTLTKNLAFLEEVIKLRSTVPGNKIYPPKSRYNIVDKTIPLELHILLRSETTNFKSLNTLTTDELDTAKSSSMSIKTYFNSLLPVDFGMVLDYQSGSAEGLSDSVRWNSLSVGPTIKYNFYKYKMFTFNTQFAVKKSLFFNVVSESQNAQISSLAWQLGVEAVFNTKYGNLSLGLDSSYIKTSIKGELQDQASFSNTKETMNQNALTVGYQYTWML